MTFEETYKRIKWLQENYGNEFLLFFLAEMVIAHQDYNFEEIFKKLYNEIIYKEGTNDNKNSNT